MLLQSGMLYTFCFTYIVAFHCLWVFYLFLRDGHRKFVVPLLREVNTPSDPGVNPLDQVLGEHVCWTFRLIV